MVSPLQLFIVICVLLVVLKLLKATAKLMCTAAVITVIVYLCINVLPNFI